MKRWIPWYHEEGSLHSPRCRHPRNQRQRTRKRKWSQPQVRNRKGCRFLGTSECRRGVVTNSSRFRSTIMKTFFCHTLKLSLSNLILIFFLWPWETFFLWPSWARFSLLEQTSSNGFKRQIWLLLTQNIWPSYWGAHSKSYSDAERLVSSPERRGRLQWRKKRRTSKNATQTSPDRKWWEEFSVLSGRSATLKYTIPRPPSHQPVGTGFPWALATSVSPWKCQACRMIPEKCLV